MAVRRMPERIEYRLSDLFQKKTDYPEFELIVTVYNINPGMNEELLEACHLLKEYMLFTAKIRENRKTMDLRLAVNKAVEDCICNGILAEFLKAQRAEVTAMSVFEYDHEKHMRLIKEDGREEGRVEGRREGQERLLTLLQYMEENNEFHLISKLHDEEFLEEMYQKYQL
ncbi:MAG: hypothetical protein J6C06_04165 [Lachnospiraceae bacterium]|nr:hypothetical protein [Lachnospiraceae bacterium]